LSLAPLFPAAALEPLHVMRILARAGARNWYLRLSLSLW
jgi:hypothetical protein